MSVKIRFHHATVQGLVLARVGHPARNEPLQTSREIYKIDEADRETLTTLFLKPFRHLTGHSFYHHTSLDKHEMHQLVKKTFAQPSTLHAHGCEIASRLYAKSTHPNIKSGDLCIALIHDIEVDGENRQALCLLKSESLVPFFSISEEAGDLRLHTGQGINPDKIDKGCLILDHRPDAGYYSLTFDRSGGESRFWIRDFLGLLAIPDNNFLTNSYAEMAVDAVRSTVQPTVTDEPARIEEISRAAQQAIAYFDDREHFDLEEFTTQVLQAPAAAAHFQQALSKVHEERGSPLDTHFEISPKEIKKLNKAATHGIIKLDTGIEIHLKPQSPDEIPPLERGYDEARSMKYIKVYYHQDLTSE